MSDNLRDALLSLCDKYERQGMGSASDFDKGAQRVAVDVHNLILDAHPVEPATKWSDEATIQAMRAFDGKAGYSKIERLCAALEAALPYLQGPEYDRGFAAGLAAARKLNEEAQPVASREALAKALHDAADVVLALIGGDAK